MLLSPTLLVLLASNLSQISSPVISPSGERLAKVLDEMGVERLWLPGHAVHWKTGTIDREGRQRATHCSTFAAAACERFGIYLLRPPEHSPTLLANAQAVWLKTPAAEKRGWRKLKSGLEAQRLANQGEVVIVSFANPNKRKPGHIAVVRPSDKPTSAIDEEGPQIIQAGSENLRSATAKRGFSKHPGAWKNRLLEYYAAAPRETSQAAVRKAFLSPNEKKR